MKDNKLILIAITLPLFTLLILSTKTFEIMNTYQEKIKLNEETHQIIIALQNLLTLIIDAETGQRGFIITGDEKYLEPYNFSLSNLNSTINEVRKLANDKHSDILENVYFNIRSLVNSKFTELNKAIDERKDKGFNASAELILTDTGKRIMEQIRNNISLVINEEEKILKNNIQTSVIDGLYLLYTYIIGIVISVIITIVTIMATYAKLNIKHNKITNLLKIEINKKTKELQQSNISLTKMNDELRKNNDMQKEFINIAAHELRTPTQSIIGYLQMLKTFPDNRKKYLEPLERNSQRLYRLTEDILDVARIESDNLKLDKEKFDINLLVKETIDEFYKKISNDNNNQFYIIFPSDHNPQDNGKLFVYADKNRIQQVIYNLLNNAYKFSKNGKIIIKIDKENNKYVKIIVKDEGQGISKEILPRLFEKFATKSEAGTGLGLYLSKNIVDTHGGSIRGYNNKDKNKGAIFEFTIPVIQ